MKNNPVEQLPDFPQIWQETLEWQPHEQQQKLLQQLYEKIILGNRSFNLTRITDPQEFWEKHLWDSLRGIRSLALSTGCQQFSQVIDIGTGAGFPGIPVAIALPQTTVTLLDSTRKKIAFLHNLTKELGLDNTRPLVGRSEEVGQQKQHREAYDLTLIRAVGEASVCAEYALPLLKLGGVAVLYRGHWTQEDTEALEKAVKKLGGILTSIEEFKTPFSESQRHCIYLRKIALTPAEFPRPIGVPNQQPL